MTVWSIITIPDAMQRLLSLFFSGRFRSSLFRAGLFLMAALAVPPVCGASGFDGGDGTREAPYLISSPEGLAALGGYCGSAHRDKHFILTGDIVLKGAWTPSAPLPPWKTGPEPSRGSWTAAGIPFPMSPCKRTVLPMQGFLRHCMRRISGTSISGKFPSPRPSGLFHPPAAWGLFPGEPGSCIDGGRERQLPL